MARTLYLRSRAGWDHLRRWKDLLKSEHLACSEDVLMREVVQWALQSGRDMAVVDKLLPLVRFPQVVCRPQPHGPRVPCPRVLHAPLCSVLPLPSWRSHASTIP